MTLIESAWKSKKEWDQKLLMCLAGNMYPANVYILLTVCTLAKINKHLHEAELTAEYISLDNIAALGKF